MVTIATALIIARNPHYGPILLAALLLLGAPFIWTISHLTYKQTAYAVDENFVYIKTGFIGLHFWVIPVGKIQNLSLTQTPFQRSRRLVSLHIDVAGGTQISEPVVPNIPISSTWLLFNRLGHIKPTARSISENENLPAQ